MKSKIVDINSYRKKNNEAEIEERLNIAKVEAVKSFLFNLYPAMKNLTVTSNNPDLNLSYVMEYQNQSYPFTITVKNFFNDDNVTHSIFLIMIQIDKEWSNAMIKDIEAEKFILDSLDNIQN